MKEYFQKIKREHILIAAIAVLFLSNIFSFFIFSEKHTNKYPLLDPDHGMYEQKDLIINVQTLRNQFEEIGKDQNVSVYFEFLNTGANISINKDIEIWPASLMKIPIAIAAMKKVEDGEWKLEKKFTIKDEDKNADFGSMYLKPTGSTVSLEELLNELLINSDNTARNILAQNLSIQEIEEVLVHIGIEYDFKNDAKISSKKYAVIWRALYSSSYLSPENSQRLIKIMTKSSAKNYLAPGIPESVEFSHKIGVLHDEKTYADAGIVYVQNRPYILVVMTKNYSQQESEEIMKDISEKAYKYISEYK